MTLFRVRVELPTYNHSFYVSISAQGTVRELKNEIEQCCQGQPRVDSQRVIWRGRILKDEERIQDIWTDSSDSMTIHLSVRPGGWTSTPPNVPDESQQQQQGFSTAVAPSLVPTALPSNPTSFPRARPALSTAATPTPAGGQPGPPPSAFYSHHHTSPVATQSGRAASNLPSRMDQSDTTVPNMHSIDPTLALNAHHLNARRLAESYISYLHDTALQALTSGQVYFDPSTFDFVNQRHHTVRYFSAVGWSWPEIFDKTYPSTASEPLSAKYELINIDNHDYLRLTQQGTPTPVQAHALNVLKQTFPLLHLPEAPASSFRPEESSNGQVHDQPGQDQRVRELRQANGRVRQLVWELDLRLLLSSLMSHCFRTMLLLWIFFPMATRQPIIGVLIMGWFFYETWKAVRTALVRLHPTPPAPAPPQAAPAGQRQPQGGPAGEPQGAAAPEPRAAAVVPRPNAPNPQNTQYTDLVLDSLSRINLQEEQAALHGRANEPPSQSRRIGSFFSLMALTTFPAYWERRRTLLRQREGIIRTELRARNALNEAPQAEDEEADDAARDAARRANEARQRARAEVIAAHERRPRWVKDYVERVGRDEWVDE